MRSNLCGVICRKLTDSIIETQNATYANPNKPKPNKFDSNYYKSWNNSHRKKSTI
jgi:hypothetical protein